jgi:hypothetical protein
MLAIKGLYFKFFYRMLNHRKFHLSLIFIDPVEIIPTKGTILIYYSLAHKH